MNTIMENVVALLVTIAMCVVPVTLVFLIFAYWG